MARLIDHAVRLHDDRHRAPERDERRRKRHEVARGVHVHDVELAGVAVDGSPQFRGAEPCEPGPGQKGAGGEELDRHAFDLGRDAPLEPAVRPGEHHVMPAVLECAELIDRDPGRSAVLARRDSAA